MVIFILCSVLHHVVNNSSNNNLVRSPVCIVVVARTSKQAVEEQRKVEEGLAEEVDTARSRISEIQNELEGVVEQLGEAKVCCS